MDNVITRLCHCGQIAWRIAQFTGYDVYECPSGHQFDASLNPPECWQSKSTEYAYSNWRAKKLNDPEIRAEFDALEEEYQAMLRPTPCAGGNVVAPSPPGCSVAISAEGGT